MHLPQHQYAKETKKPLPVIISIHGGPEGQSRPRFSSTFQLWIEKLGVAVITPNVRGSEGYGKTYLGLDNGFNREDSVKDIGSLLDWIEKQPNLDSSRVAVYGGSYGGYMVLASAVVPIKAAQSPGLEHRPASRCLEVRLILGEARFSVGKNLQNGNS